MSTQVAGSALADHSECQTEVSAGPAPGARVNCVIAEVAPMGVGLRRRRAEEFQVARGTVISTADRLARAVRPEPSGAALWALHSNSGERSLVRLPESTV
jgi:hypothetical protein